MQFRIVGAKAHLDNHFLTVVRPAFRKGITHPDAFELGRVAVRMQELQKMPRPDFMCRRERESRDAGDVRRLLSFGPFWIRRCDIEYRGHTLVVGTRYLDERKV